MQNQLKVLITGGGGFLGSYVVDELLKKNYHVFSFSRKSYESLEQRGATCLVGNLNNFEDVSKAVEKVDAVIHTAALAGVWGKWEDFYTTNFLGTKNIVKACLLHNVRNLVYTSSPSVVFNGDSIEGQGEELPYARKHLSHYPVTKAMAEKYVLDANSDNLKTSALRPHLIWGPNDPHFMPRLLDRANSGKLKQIGDGENLVDVIFVENAALAHVQVLEKLITDPQKTAGKTYFIGQEKPVKLWDFVNRLILAAGGKPVKKRIPFWLGYLIGIMMEKSYSFLRIFSKEPLLTKFLVLQLAKSHYFAHGQAIEDFDYKANVGLEEGFDRLKKHYDK